MHRFLIGFHVRHITGWCDLSFEKIKVWSDYLTDCWIRRNWNSWSISSGQASESCNRKPRCRQHSTYLLDIYIEVAGPSCGQRWGGGTFRVEYLFTDSSKGQSHNKVFLLQSSFLICTFYAAAYGFTSKFRPVCLNPIMDGYLKWRSVMTWRRTWLLSDQKEPERSSCSSHNGHSEPTLRKS